MQQCPETCQLDSHRRRSGLPSPGIYLRRRWSMRRLPPMHYIYPRGRYRMQRSFQSLMMNTSQWDSKNNL